MCFAVPEDGDDASLAPNGVSEGFGVSFRSEDPSAPPCPKGHLWVGMPTDCATEMVSNMLGDPCPSEESLRDGVAELANVIVGQLFLECAPEAGHHLGTPQPMQKPGPDSILAEVQLEFDVGAATVVLSMA